MWHSYMTWPAPDEPTYPPRRSFFFQAEDGIRDWSVTGVQTCALPIWFITSHNAPTEAVKNRAAARSAVTSGPWASMAGQVANKVRLTRLPPQPNSRCDQAQTSAPSKTARSEERRVGKECRARTAPCE